MPPGADVLDVVVRVLAPYLGENMARASVRGHAERLGVRGDRMLTGDLESLLAALGPGLSVFVGRDKTARILDEVRAALDAPRSAR